MNNTEIGRYYQELFDLQDKVAVVIGGTGVLCGEMAGGLLRAGCRVVLAGRNQGKAESHFRAWGDLAQRAMFVKADVRKRAEVAGLLKSALDTFAQVDIWVNGAAIAPPNPYLAISDDEFDQVMALNIRAVHLGCQVIGRHWIDHQKGGSIINMSSMSALRPLSRSFIYSLSKAGVLNLTQNLAREWAEHGIRVNALCPGFFPAEQNRAILDKDRIENIMRLTPLARFGEPAELVGATFLLASDRAGGFITGSNLIVDGGFAVKSI